MTLQQLEMWPVDKIRPYARNPRRNDQAVDRMVTAIREFGFKIPVLVRSDGELIDGHLRLKAALNSGYPNCPSSCVTNGRRRRLRPSGFSSTGPQPGPNGTLSGSPSSWLT